MAKFLEYGISLSMKMPRPCSPGLGSERSTLSELCLTKNWYMSTKIFVRGQVGVMLARHFLPKAHRYLGSAIDE